MALTTRGNTEMFLKIIVILGLTAVIGLSLQARFVTAQTLDENTVMIVRESKKYSQFKGGEYLDDPTDQPSYFFSETDNRKSQKDTLVIPDRLEGDWFTQAIIVTIVDSTPPPGYISVPNQVTTEQARSIVYTNLRNYVEDLSNRYLHIVPKTNPNGDIFTVTISLPLDNCEFEIVNQLPSLINAQLPVGNKLSDLHSSLFILNQQTYTQGGCEEQGSASVSRARMKDKGQMVWISENLFLNNPRIGQHEIIHNFGTNHSSLARPNGDPNPLNWTRTEYGDQVCIMGGGSGRLNSYQLHRFGWYRGNPFKELTNSGNYEFHYPYFEGNIGAKGLMKVQNGYFVLKDSNGVPNGLVLYPQEHKNIPEYDDLSLSFFQYYRRGLSLRWGPADTTGPAVNSVLIHTNTSSSQSPTFAPMFTVGQTFTIFNVTVGLRWTSEPKRGVGANLAF